MAPDVQQGLGAAARRLGPIKLASGITAARALLLLATLLTMRIMVDSIYLLQPILFRNLNVMGQDVGRLAGTLTTVQQLTMLCLISAAGVMADRLGRKAVLLLAMTGFTLCCIAFPLAGTVAMLFAVRILFGLASPFHTAGAATLVVDYPANESRGKFLALIMLVQTAVTSLIVGMGVSRLPELFGRLGASSSQAVLYSFWLLSAIGAVGIVLAVWGIRDLRPRTQTAASGGMRAMRDDIGALIAHARNNPRFGLLMMIAFVTRTDAAVVASFLSLWITQAGSAQGLEAEVALKTAGSILAVMNIAGFVTPPLFGYLADRFNRIGLLIFALAATGVAFTATALVDDAFGWMIFGVFILIGIAEGAQTISTQTMFGEETPEHLRGSAIGFFAFIGSLSVILVSFLGGLLYDSLGHAAPFVLVGLLNLIFCVVTIIVAGRWRRRAQRDAVA